MKRICALLAVVLLVFPALVACSSSAPQETEKIPTEPTPTFREAQDLSAAETLLVREVLKTILDDLYSTPEKEKPEKGLLGDFQHVVRVYVYDQKTYDCAVRIVKSITRRADQGKSIVLSNGTSRPLVLKIGSEWWPIEVPLQAGDRRRYNGAGIQYLDEVEVEIADPKDE